MRINKISVVYNIDNSIIGKIFVKKKLKDKKQYLNYKKE